jgi:hypothetical protein
MKPDLTPGLQVLEELANQGADPEDYSRKVLDQVRESLNNDLLEFCRAIFGFDQMIPEVHGAVATLIKRWADSDISPRLMFQLPRGSFKTSLCSRANPLWQVCREPDETVVIFNERLENTQRWIRSIKETVQGSKLFQLVYRDLLPPGVAHNDTRSMPRNWKWSDTELLFQRDKPSPEASITGSGIEAAATGMHWHKMILDDLISIRAKESEAEMEHAREWCRTHTFLMRPADGGKALVACTPWTYNDIYVDMVRDYGYHVYRRAGLEDEHGEPDHVNGKSILPHVLPTESLLEQRDRNERRGEVTFFSMVQCQPRPGTDQSFNLQDFKYGACSPENEEPYFTIEREFHNPKPSYCDEEDHPLPRVVHLHQMEKAIIWDPAPTEPGKDPGARNGWMVEGWDPWGRRYVLESVAAREDPSKCIDTCLDLMKRWRTMTVGIEEVVFSLTYRYWLRERALARGMRNPRVVILKPKGREKHTRIQAQIPNVKEGLYFVNRSLSGKFLKEVSEYPHGSTVDLLDAWAYDNEVLRRPRSSAEIRKQRLSQPTQLDPTGYGSPVMALE